MKGYYFKCYSCKKELGHSVIPPLKCYYCGKDTVGIMDEKLEQG